MKWTKFLKKMLYSVQATELSTWQRRVSELTGRISELEETLAKTQKELLKAQETNAKLQRDLRENVAQKEDQVGLFNLLLLYSIFPICNIS
jgi:septal ring factor EnvC (AmiA/AmiB activator)